MFFCEEYIYAGAQYYVLNGFNCCEQCLDIHFKSTAELPDLETEKMMLKLLMLIKVANFLDIKFYKLISKKELVLLDMCSKKISIL